MKFLLFAFIFSGYLSVFTTELKSATNSWSSFSMKKEPKALDWKNFFESSDSAKKKMWNKLVKKPKDSAEEVTLGVRSPPRCASRPRRGCGGCSRSPTRSPPPCRPACSPVCAVQRRRRPRHRRRDERHAHREGGSTAAAPLFSEVAKVMIDYYDVKPAIK